MQKKFEGVNQQQKKNNFFGLKRQKRRNSSFYSPLCTEKKKNIHFIMSAPPRCGMKRENDGQLRKEDDDDGDYTDRNPRSSETFVTTPQLASAEEMSKRRVIHVTRRPTNGAPLGESSSGKPGNAGPFGSSSLPSAGVFKSLQVPMSVPSVSIPASTPSLLPTSPPIPSTVQGSHDSTSTEKAQSAAIPSASDTPAVASSRPTATATGAAPTPSLSSSVDPKPLLFPSFGASHSAGLSTTAVAGGTSTTTTTAGGSAPPIFPPGAFSFGNAVSSFVEARKNAEEVHKARQTHEEGQGKPEDGGDGASSETTKEGAEEGSPSTFFSSSSSFQAAPGEVLASGPSKLFRFDKPNNKWVECGEGEAKLKREKKLLPSSTTTAEKTEGTTTPLPSGADASVSSSSSASPTDGNGQEEGEEVVRLLVRDGYSLNVIVAKGAFILTSSPSSTTAGNTNSSSSDTKNNVTEKHLVFTVNSREDGVRHYLLKFTGSAAANNAKAFGDRLNEVC